MMKIGIIGGGVVGSALAAAYREPLYTGDPGHEVKVWDTVAERRNATFEEVAACPIILLCLPTPFGVEGLSTQYIEGCLGNLAPLLRVSDNPRRPVVIKSTVPVGTTARMLAAYRLPGLLHSPEFIDHRTAYEDSILSPREIVGHPKGGDSESVGLYGHVVGNRFPARKIHLMDSNESELVKLATNSFLAVKNTFFNSAFDLCYHMGLDYDAVRKGITGDGRITEVQSKVPGPDGKLGYGGACLPKDFKQYLEYLHDYNVVDGVWMEEVPIGNRKRRGE